MDQNFVGGMGVTMVVLELQPARRSRVCERGGGVERLEWRRGWPTISCAGGALLPTSTLFVIWYAPQAWEESYVRAGGGSLAASLRDMLARQGKGP